MVKNTKQIALIQNRRGRLSELPTQLNDGEFGLATDTNELFIGNGSNPALAERIAENKFPWGNVQILTEFTDNLKIITYRYESNTNIEARLPIIISSTKSPEVFANTSIKINGVEVLFEDRAAGNPGLPYIINTINAEEGLNVKAFVNNDNRLSLITTDTELTLEDTDKTYQGIGLIEWLGFGTESFYSAVSGVPSERSLQDVLDDFVSAKSYDISGNGQDDDSEAIYNAIISLNKAGNSPEYYRTLFFPAGNYIIDSKTIPLPHGTHIKGEGMGRTIFTARQISNAIMTTMDNNMILGTDSYGLYNHNTKDETDEKSLIPQYITVEDITIDASESNLSSIIKLNSCENVEFKNVEIIGKGASFGILFLGDSNHILFDNCIFNGSSFCSDFSLENIIVRNCLFKNIINEAIKLDAKGESEIINCLFEGNIFTNCSSESDSVIYLGENSSYVNFTNSRFDKDIAEGNSTTIPYITLSELNYTDTLDSKTDTKKVLQFKFTQPTWEYIDYLMNPHGEYLVKPNYNYIWINGEEQPAHITNGLILEQGDETNDNTFTISSSNSENNFNITAGSLGSLQLGKNINGLTYDYFIAGNYYHEGDKIVYENDDGSFRLFKCILAHQSNEDEAIYENNVFVKYNDTYWEDLGTFYPKIEFHKNIDLNNHYITDSVSNITFKTDANMLVIDDNYNEMDKKSKSYAQRIAPNKMAIPNVDYVNTIAQSTIRKTFSFDTLSSNGTHKQEIVYFDPTTYGDAVNLNYTKINVRKPFYPIIPYANPESAFPWKAGNKYYEGEIVVAKTEFTDGNEQINKFCELIDGAWVEIPHERYMKLNESQMDSFDPETGVRKPLINVGSIDDYAFWYEPIENNKRYTYKKCQIGANVVAWLNVEEAEYANLHSSYIESAENKTCKNGAIMNINGINITMISDNDDVTIDEAVVLINEKTSSTGVVASKQNNKLRLKQEPGVIEMYDGLLSPLDSFGFKINPYTLKFEVNVVKMLITFDNIQPTPTGYIDGSIWLDTIGRETYLVCRLTHISSNNLYEDMGIGNNQFIINKWQEVFIEVPDINDTNEEPQMIPLKDLKYVSILARSDDDINNPTLGERRLLFAKNIIDVSKRDINSIYELNWEADKSYEIGDRCLSHGRYWKCLKSHTSTVEDELHNAELWTAVNEEGYNYHFDFERNLYKVDENGNIVVADDETIINYNFSNYHLYLMLYDELTDDLIEFITSGDIKHSIQVNPNGYMLITMNYIRGAKEESLDYYDEESEENGD